MNGLKFILGLLALVLSLLLIGALIWIALFGIPQGRMEGGTLVETPGNPVMYGEVFRCE